MQIIKKSSVTPKHFQDFINFKQDKFSGLCHKSLIDFLAQTPPDILLNKKNNIKIFKDKANIVFSLEIPSEFQNQYPDITIKKCKHRNLWRFILSPLKKSKAKKSFLAAKNLINNNLDTPTPLAYLDKRQYGFITDNYYITETMQNYCKLKPLYKNTTEENIINTLLAGVADYSIRMHAAKIIHGDFNLGNFIISGKTSKKRLVLIDLNRCKLKKVLLSFTCVRDIGRLYWRDHRTQFFKLYSKKNQSVKKWEWFFNFYYIWRKKRRKFKKFFKHKRSHSKNS